MQNTGLQIKKIILGVFVVGAFIAYSLHSRNDSKPVVASNTSGSSSTTAASPSPSSGTSGSTDPSSSSSGSSSSSAGNYKDGTYQGSVADAFYGNIQVSVVISGGKITDVQFLQFPNDNPNSQNINSQAMPLLKQEAIKSQSANVDVISGATDTSQAFVQSLQAALSQA